MKHLLVSLFSLFCVQLQAQQYSFINYSVEKGLASSQVIDICQDELGYIWVGTQSGLSRFDGIKFQNYSVNEGLPDNKIENLYLAPDGRLWVATQKGIGEFQNSNDRFKSYFFRDDKTEIDLRINSLVYYQNSVYVASDSGIFVLKNQKLNKLEDSNGQKPKIREMVNINDTALYCGTNHGLLIWRGKAYENFSHDILDSANISDLSFVNGTLFVSTIRNGIVTYNFSAKSTENYTDLSSSFRSIYADTSIILGSSRGGGVIEITKNGSFHYNNESGLINELVRCSYVDSERNVWLGTDGSGLFKFSGKSLVSYHVEDGLSSELVISITQARDCTYVFGTYNAGVTIQRPDGGFTYLGSANGLRHTRVWGVAVSDDQRYYLATQNGVDFIELSETDTIVQSTGVDSKSRALHFLSTTDLLAGGVDGIYEILGDNSQQIMSSVNLDINKIVSTDHYMYVGANSGLFECKLSERNFNFRQVLLAENNVQTLCADRNNNLWIGTEFGLFLKSNKDWIRPFELDKNEFFRSKNIVAIIEDHVGNIWISTYNGVYLLNVKDAETYDYDTKHYTLAEGLVDLEGNQNALYEDHLHRIWVGTSKGLVRIDPSLNDALFDLKRPNLHFTGIRLFTEKFIYTDYEIVIDSITGVPKEITLPYSKNHVTFDFIGISMKDPEAVKYSYRLASTEEDEWSPISSTNYATYSGIAPGIYDFEVKAANKNTEWSDIQSIKIVVLPPFWRSWWFYILIGLLVGGLIVSVFQVRIRAIKQKQENERLSFKNRLLFLEQRALNASMNRHFIFNSLNSIQYFINSSDKLSANKYLSNFAKLIRKNLDSSTSNNFIVTLQEEVERIELYLSLEKMRFHDKFDYEIEISEDMDAEEVEIPSMILQPFVENSIIHGVLPKEGGGLIKVIIYQEYDEVVFEVVDNGIGIDNSLINKDVTLSGDHESKGMEITNRRIELLRKLTGENLLIIGPFQLNSEEGVTKGTKVIIKMGLSREFAEDEDV